MFCLILSADVMVFGSHLVVYLSSMNVRIFVVASSSVNELVVDQVMRALEDALTSLLKGVIDTRGIIDNMDYVLLAIDELVDEGIIFQIDGEDISSRIMMSDLMSPTQETLYDAYQKARDQWLK